MSLNLTLQSAFSHLPCNQAAENNKQPILQALQRLNLLNTSVLEVGSGTGQHGIYFCANTPELVWQPTETAEQLPLLSAWYQVAHENGLNNFCSPLSYTIEDKSLPLVVAETIYCANVLHIIQPHQAQRLIQQVCKKLKVGDRFICYGPFKLNGEFTTESNRDFHFWLQSQGYGGLLDMADIVNFSQRQLTLEHKVEMPANNFLLVWQKQ